MTRIAAPTTKSALRCSQSAAPATKSAFQDSHAADKVFRRKNASKDNVQLPKRSFCARLPPISVNDPRVQKSQFTAPGTKLERIEDHRAPCPKCCACHEICISKQHRSDPLHLSRKVDFGPPKHEVSLALATKSDHQVGKCAQRHNASAVATSTRRGQADFARLRSRNALRGFRDA